WNPAMERLSNRGRGQTLGRSAFEIFPALKESAEARCLEEALRGKSGRARLASLDGEDGRWLEGYYVPVRGAGEEVLGGLAVVREIRRPPEPQPVQTLGASEPIVINGRRAPTAGPPPRREEPAREESSDWLSFN